MTGPNKGAPEPETRTWFSALFASPPQHAGYFQLIDIMRGFAALTVIFWHYQHFFYPPGDTRAIAGFQAQQPWHDELSLLYAHGKYAVQLFWVISGFVFAYVYYARRSTMRGFVVNRIARLYPLHLLTLLIVAGLQGVAQLRIGHPLVYQENGFGNFLLHLGLASNWWPKIVYSFNGPIWSVSIEILVYALFWLLLPFLFRGGVALPAIIAAGSMIACFHLNGYILFTCAACFFGGAAIFALHARATWLALLVIVLLAHIGQTAWVASVDMRQYVAVPLLAMALVLAVAMIEPRINLEGLRHFRWLGDASYGIYLWHFPVQLVLFLTVPGLALDHQIARSPAFLLLFLGIVIAIAVLSFHVFERPARRWLRGVLEAPQSRSSHVSTAAP